MLLVGLAGSVSKSVRVTRSRQLLVLSCFGPQVFNRSACRRLPASPARLTVETQVRRGWTDRTGRHNLADRFDPSVRRLG
jgi:hypothetical protein